MFSLITRFAAINPMQMPFKPLAWLGNMAILLAVAGCRTPMETSSFSNWPAGASPQEIGKRVADNFISRKLGFQSDPRKGYVHYAEVCTWYGSLTVAQLTSDEKLK